VCKDLVRVLEHGKDLCAMLQSLETGIDHLLLVCNNDVTSFRFTACFPFQIGALTIRPCVRLAFTPCNVTWFIYADSSSNAHFCCLLVVLIFCTGIPLSGSIPISSIPNTITTSSTVNLWTITFVAGCTAQVSLTNLVYTPRGALTGSVTILASCPLIVSGIAFLFCICLLASC
jgi:hypothetical protein